MRPSTPKRLFITYTTLWIVSTTLSLSTHADPTGGGEGGNLTSGSPTDNPGGGRGVAAAHSVTKTTNTGGGNSSRGAGNPSPTAPTLSTDPQPVGRVSFTSGIQATSGTEAPVVTTSSGDGGGGGGGGGATIAQGGEGRSSPEAVTTAQPELITTAPDYNDSVSMMTTGGAVDDTLVTTASAIDVLATTATSSPAEEEEDDLFPCGNVTFTQVFNSSCNPCYATRAFGCPQNARFLREVQCGGYARSSQFCAFECQLALTYPQCCAGHWGPDCQLCPGTIVEPYTGHNESHHAAGGNITLPCSGRGDCSEGLEGDGTCACHPRFAGYACERCASPVTYGPDCNQQCRCQHGACDAGVTGTGRCDCFVGWTGENCDRKAKCNSSLCGLNARCEDAVGQSCVCLPGFTGDASTQCTAINYCLNGGHECASNADCLYDGPGNYSCTCHEGFQGDGLWCDPIDHCQNTANPPCPLNSSSCEYQGPGLHSCKCLPGFANFTEGRGCAMRDLCTEGAPVCHENAKCSMVAPNKFRCRCRPGYVGNGKVCYGNIIQSLTELNARGQFKNQLTKALKLYKFALGEALETTPHLTVFVPIERGLNRVRMGSLMSDRTAGAQTVKNHVLPVARTLRQLIANTTSFYTLEGSEVVINKRRGKVRFRLARTNLRGTVLKGNFPASNGIIHIMDTLVYKPPVIGHKKRQTLLTQIQTDGRYNRLEGLLGSTGLTRLLNSTIQNYTVFTPNNRVWDSLGDGILQYLQSRQGKAKLETLLKNHIVAWDYYSFDMLRERHVRTLANNVIQVTVSAQGQILLNGNVSITQTDIPAINGVYQHVTGVLMPESVLPILDSRCDVHRAETVNGRCLPCTAPPRCQLSTDELLNNGNSTEQCDIVEGTTIRGCRPKCRRVVTEEKCCANFYGAGCDPCPGGPFTPCDGRGTCDDGLTGNGTCSCHRNFTGAICERCSDPQRHGPTCSTQCKCLNGVCDNRVLSVTGFCKQGTCEEGYVGLFCHQTRQRCGLLVNKNCHANAYCTFFNQSDLLEMLLPGHDDVNPAAYGTYANMHFKILQLQASSRCQCQDGYEGDGVDSCTAVNPCEQPQRGDCHREAECSYLSPGQNECKCNRGWVGDGLYCYPSTPCLHQGHCHRDAYCESASPGEFQCVCRKGFHGNGSYCVPDNMCDYNNGGCSPLATCIALGPGNRTCTCATGYGGDGVTCIGSLWQQLQMVENLVEFRRQLTNNSSDLHQLLSDVTRQYTIFAPDDIAMVTAHERGLSCVSGDAGLRYYILPHRFSLQQLQKFIQGPTNNAFLPTLALDTSGKAREIKISYASQILVNKAHILMGNHTALNGIIHVIDSCLAPHKPAANITNLLTGIPRFSNFITALTQVGLMSTLESLDSFTLFALDNVHWKVNKLNGSELQKFMSYYVVPKRVPMDNLPAFLQEETIMGTGPSSLLNITTKNGQTFVNNFIIFDDRLRTPTGTVYRLSHALDPNLHRCDKLGSAGKLVRECCSGYFGYDCLPCPGGARTPCSQHGRCSQGIDGTGQCQCTEGYTSAACDKCDEGFLPKGDSECRHDPCIFCDFNAECVHIGNTTHCRCAGSYVGDGTQCAHVCSVKNGGCDPHANCTSSVLTGHKVHCQCPPEFYGDGFNCTRIVSLFDTVKTLKETQDFYQLVNSESQEWTPDIKDLLKNEQNITLFVPQNWAGNISVNETGVDVRRHILNDYLELHPSLLEQEANFSSLSGDPLLIDYNPKERTYTVNGSMVVRRNIPSTNNCIVHIIDEPLRPPPTTGKTSAAQGPFSTMAIVIATLGALLLLSIIIVVLVVWKCRGRYCCLHGGGSYSEGGGGGGSAGFKFLMLDDREDRSKDVGLIDAASTYQNPLYDTLESAGLTDENIW